MGSARGIANSADRYIRPVTRGGVTRFQARPYDEGVRYDLGLFQTQHQARRAVYLFWAGQIESLPRYTKKVHFRGGVKYAAMRPGGGPKLGLFDTREDAAAAVRAHIERQARERAEREVLDLPDVHALVEQRVRQAVEEAKDRRVKQGWNAGAKRAKPCAGASTAASEPTAGSSRR
jgi:hypothetical protein